MTLIDETNAAGDFKYRVVLGIPQTSLRRVLRWALEDTGSFSVVHETDNGSDVIAAASLADLVVLHAGLSDGSLICTIETLRDANVKAHVCIIGAAVPYLEEAVLSLGADSCLGRTTSVDEIVSQLLISAATTPDGSHT